MAIALLVGGALYCIVTPPHDPTGMRKVGYEKSFDSGLWQTELHQALCEKDIAAVESMRRHGAFVEVANSRNYRPLYCLSGAESDDIAVRQLRLIDMLVQAGADVNAPNGEFGESALQGAARNGAPQVVEKLITCGAEVNHRDQSGRTPLHEAVDLHYAGRRWDEVIHLLLRHGADPNRRDNNGETPLDAAIRRKNDAAITILREAMEQKAGPAR